MGFNIDTFTSLVYCFVSLHSFVLLFVSFFILNLSLFINILTIMVLCLCEKKINVLTWIHKLDDLDLVPCRLNSFLSRSCTIISVRTLLGSRGKLTQNIAFSYIQSEKLKCHLLGHVCHSFSVHVLIICELIFIIKC